MTGEAITQEPEAPVEWIKVSDHCWQHVSGNWTIGRYVVSGKDIYLLWEGQQPRGRFRTLGGAQTHHAKPPS